MSDSIVLTLIAGPYILMFIAMFIVNLLSQEKRIDITANDFDPVTFSDSHIPYEELQLREEINSLSLEEIDELFSSQDDVWSAIEDEDAHSMIDADYGIEYKADDSVSINYEMFEDTIPF